MQKHGEYKEIRLLGRGNFGAAYLVEKLDQPGAGEMRVMKKIALQELKEDEVKGAQKEAQCHSELDHPRIVKYYESFTIDTFLCIIMEFCSGGDLSKVLKEQSGSVHTCFHPLLLSCFLLFRSTFAFVSPFLDFCS